MNNLMSGEMTRQQKEEFATQRMIEMREKNQRLTQRHKEVEEDRIEAEKQQASVTSIPKTKPFPKSSQDPEEFPRSHANPKVEREWDIGKGQDGDWSSPKDQDYDSSRNQRRGGYSSGWNNRNDSHRRPRGDYQTRDNYRSYDNNKWSDSNRENGRYQNSSYRGRCSFPSDNTRNYAKSGTPQNWSEDSKRQFNRNQSHSSQNNQNSYSKPPHRYTTDKMWRDEGMNDVQHKQNRVESWVKSINSVDEWTENEDKNAVGSAKNFGNNTRCIDKNEQQDHEFSSQRQNYARNRGNKYDEFPQKSNTHYGDKSYEDHRKPAYNQEDRSNNYNLKVTVSGERKSFIERRAEMHMQGKPVKHNFNQESQNYDHTKETRRQVYAEKNNDKYSGERKFGTKEEWGVKNWEDKQKKRNSGNWSEEEHNGQESGNWNNNRNRNQQEKKHSGNWGDKSAPSHPTKKSSGNWSEEECNNQTTKKNSGNWDSEASNNQPDKKDSESWTDIDSTENETRSFQDRASKVKRSAKQSYDNNNKKDYTFSGSRNDGNGKYENQHTKNNVRTWKDVAEHRQSKQGNWGDVGYSKKTNKVDDGTWDDIDDNSKNLDGEAKFKGPTKFSNQSEKDPKCAGSSWGVKKFDKPNKTGGTWSDEDDNQNFERDNINKRQYNRSSSKTYQRPNVNAEIGRSKSFQEASHKSNRTNFVQKKDSGTWSDQECDNANDTNCGKWSGKWDAADENNEVSKDGFDYQSSCSVKEKKEATSKDNEFVSIVNNEEKSVDLKEIYNQQLECGEVLKQSNDEADRMHKSELSSQVQAEEKNILDEDSSKETSFEADRNESCTIVSNVDENKIEDYKENQLSFNAVQLSKEIPSTKSDGQLSDSQNEVSADTSEIFQQSLSEDSAFLEPCASETNDSKSSLQESEGEKPREANDDSVLCSSSHTTKTEIEINEFSSPSNLNQSDALSESNIDSGALSTTNNDEKKKLRSKI